MITQYECNIEFKLLGLDGDDTGNGDNWKKRPKLWNSSFSPPPFFVPYGTEQQTAIIPQSTEEVSLFPPPQKSLLSQTSLCKAQMR